MWATIACAVVAREALASPRDRLDSDAIARPMAPVNDATAGLALAPIARVRSIVAAVDADPALDPVPPIAPDPPARRGSITVGPDHLPPAWDLDGTYLWLGPVGAASHVDGRWDSTFGAEAAVIVVREQETLAAFGASLGASRWTARGGGRIWLDGVAGTRVFGRMLGASLGPIAELSELKHPRLGASVGVWGFAGITPFARAGAVSDLGMFLEIGIHIALPALRR